VATREDASGARADRGRPVPAAIWWVGAISLAVIALAQIW
jgi:hypothetical protein